MKKAVIFMIIIIFTGCLSLKVSAVNSTSEQDLYEREYELSGAETLTDALPHDIRKQLEDIGINSPSWQELNSLSFSEIGNKITDILQEQSFMPLSVLVKITGVILLVALIESLKNSFSSSTLSTVINSISVMTVSVVLIRPLSEVIAYAVNVINVSADFMAVFLPIMATVMISSGQILQGGGNYRIVMWAGTVVSQVARRILVPLLNIFLGISVVGGISERINLNGFCELTSKVIRWVLTFVMSVFTAILTMQSIIAVSGDSASVRATRFAISSFVPLVGGALSEAYQTVRSCMGMLKSGVGVFSIIATGIIYLPAVLSCILWLIAMNIAIALAGVFDSGQIIRLLRSTASVISTLLAILLCCMMIFIISSTVMLMIGGSSS
ncbi:MAG: stage III sporulation protein AE [Clostridia bacterium]|nr:stage III sporulation protein AE [Clostridia bacterium]